MKSVGVTLRKNLKQMSRDYQAYILLLPALAYYLIFHYLPMYGIQMAFQNFSPAKGFSGSPWVGFDNFFKLVSGPYFFTILRNTLTLSLYSLIMGFPLPIAFALLLNIIPGPRYKKIAQMVSYAPHFISLVVVVGMIKLFTSPSYGVINRLITKLGGESINFMIKSEWFAHIYVWSGIWQNIGWSSIIYLAALSSINPELYDSAYIDGANQVQCVWHIDLPGIAPTIIILLIMATGRVLSVGFEKVYLMQNNANLGVSEVISTYAYKQGIGQGRFSESAAVSFFNSSVNLVLLAVVNQIARKVTETSLW